MRRRDECTSAPTIVVHDDVPDDPREHVVGVGRRCWCQPDVRHVAQRWARVPR